MELQWMMPINHDARLAGQGQNHGEQTESRELLWARPRFSTNQLPGNVIARCLRQIPSPSQLPELQDDVNCHGVLRKSPSTSPLSIAPGNQPHPAGLIQLTSQDEHSGLFKLHVRLHTRALSLREKGRQQRSTSPRLRPSPRHSSGSGLNHRHYDCTFCRFAGRPPDHPRPGPPNPLPHSSLANAGR
jgi:hypothetical protein